METIEVADTTPGADSGGGGGQPRSPLTLKQRLRYGAGAVAVVGVIVYSFFESKVRTTLTTVILAVAVSAGIWVGANMLFNQVRSQWVRFNNRVTLATASSSCGKPAANAAAPNCNKAVSITLASMD